MLRSSKMGLGVSSVQLSEI